MMVWVKKSLLGSGTYGRVHRAIKSGGLFRKTKEIAVKSANMKNSHTLIREAAMLRSLRVCPHIVPCFGFDISVERGGQVFNLLLEYAPGGTLQQVIQGFGGIMPESLVAIYAYQLLRALDYMHLKGFIHCDLKPANVLIFPGKYSHGLDRLKLCDLGLAKFSGESDDLGDCHCGTLMYAPPESLIDGVYEVPKDIWALGLIVLEMFTGKPMCQVGNNADDLAMKIASTEPEIPDGISLNAKDFLKMCLERDPRRRWTAEALIGHPFVRTFLSLDEDEDDGFVNPFGCSWSCSRDQVKLPSTYVPDFIRRWKLPLP